MGGTEEPSNRAEQTEGMLSEAEAIREAGWGGMRGGAKEVKNKKKFQNRFAERDRGSRNTQFRLLCYISLDEQIYKALSIPYMHSKNTVTDITVRNKLHFLSCVL